MTSLTLTSEASTSEDRILVQGPNKQDIPCDEAQQSLGKTIRTIKSHFSSRHLESGLILDLNYELGEEEFREIRRVLDEAGANYELDENTYTLLEEFALSCWFRLKSEILTSEEARCLRAGVTSVCLNGRIKGKGTKHQAKKKSPDRAFTFYEPQARRGYYNVIFEAGFTETYDDLIRDMKQWLLHSGGQVQLVSDSFRDRAANILRNFGNSLGRSKHVDILSLTADDCVQQKTRTAHIPSTPVKGLDYGIDDVVQVKDWVGPITADMEFWVLKDSEPYRRDHARVFPELIGHLPSIYAGDVIPLSCQGSFPNFDASRQLHLDLEEFRSCLRDGIFYEASKRALEFACPTSEDDEDEDYQE
ncbi:hypothetical protein BJX96DRAFT_166259 [Aspergillus floccosus]